LRQAAAVVTGPTLPLLAMSAAWEETNDSCIPLSTWLLLLLLQ